MKITNAEVRRISNMPPLDRYDYLKKQSSVALETIVRKARDLASESLVTKKIQEEERFSEVIETAVIIIPEKKYPGAMIVVLLFCFLIGCSAPRATHTGLTYEKITSVEKIKDGTIVTIVGSRGKYIVPSDTVKIGDTIAVSWIQPLR